MFTGSIAALVTPMTSDMVIDYSALEGLVDWHIKQNTNGLVVLGTTGEAATISAAERAQIVQYVVKQVAGRFPVLVGTGSFSTQLTIEMSLQAQQAGADGVLVVTPYYNKPTQEGLFQHYSALSSALKLPIVLYNVPSRTAVDLLPETAARLARLPNVVAIKDASADISRVSTLVDAGLVVLSGDDATALELIQAGGHGVISVVANVLPAAMSQMIEAARRGRGDVVELNRTLEPWYEAMFVESNPIPVKWVLSQMGKIPAGIRLPLTRLSVQGQQAIDSLLPQRNLVL